MERRLIKVTDSVLIHIGDSIVLPFVRVYQFPLTPDSYLAHIKIWDSMAPFYFLFTEMDKQKLGIKGYDKNNKMYLRCNTQNPQYEIVYYPIKNVDDMIEVERLKSDKHLIFDGYEESSMDTYHVHGEAIELKRL